MALTLSLACMSIRPTMPAYVGTRSGPMLAAADRFTLTIHGSGGHAARPQGAVDPIALAGIFITSVQQIVSRRLDPLDPGVITIGTDPWRHGQQCDSGFGRTDRDHSHLLAGGACAASGGTAQGLRALSSPSAAPSI